MLISCCPTATGDCPSFFFTLKPPQHHSSSPTTPFSPTIALSCLLKPNKPKFNYYPLRPPPPPSLPRLFSTVTPQHDQSTPVHHQQQPSSSFSSAFGDVKSKLKQQQQQQHQQQPQPSMARHGPFLIPTSPAAKVASLEEIRQNLSEFRRRSAIPDPTRTGVLPSPSFEELYKKNAAAREAGSRTGTTEGIPTNRSLIFSSSLNGNKPLGSGKLSFETIRESVRKMGSNNPTPAGMDKRVNPPMPFSELKMLQGGTGESVLPQAVWGKEEKMEGGGADGGMMDTEFVKEYTRQELGEKLASLRPDEAERKKKPKEEGRWFPLEELQERLTKLRALEDRVAETRIGGLPFKALRESLVKVKTEEEEKRKRQMQRLNVLTHLGQMPNFMLQPPKKHLVEKYFHPDNMSASEKLKIELAKVRDEFKLSESDFGSARVQVAQLTTKIKYLSSVLHKKDKHSLKGLQAMVQQRKKLLKYLRRTDWDSYCFVLSKLGLRDNPDYKIRSH